MTPYTESEAAGATNTLRPLTHPSGMSRERASVDATQSERWLPIDGFKGYEVSDFGRVRSIDRLIPASVGSGQRLMRGRVLRTWTHSFGYKTVRLRAHNKRSTLYVHLLVLTAFRGPCPSGMVCCHIDGNPANSRLDNLRWGTQSDNILDQVRHGSHPWGSRTHCSRGHEYPSDPLRRSGGTARRCRPCEVERTARRKAIRVAQRKEAAASCGGG